MKILFGTSLMFVMALGLFGPVNVYAGDITCNDITWKPEIIKRFPDVVTGCREVVVQNGHLFARFEARLIRARVTTGEVKVKILLPDGGEVERIFHAPPNFMVNASRGGRYCIYDLEHGELMDILISDHSFALAGYDHKGDVTLAQMQS